MANNKYRLEFVVKAKSWQDVVKVFKEDLDIDSGKQDASDRKVNGFFIVQVWITEDRLDSDFYNKINESDHLALSYDPSAKKIRNDILNRVCIIEHDLRKLLLHISDVVEDYFKIYDKTTVAKVYKNNREIVRKGDVNPITSYLTLEDEINIFSIDLSPWNNKPLTANDLLELFDSFKTVDDVKETLRTKTKPHTIWDTVNRYILKSDESWMDLLPKLSKLKDIRNKAAHFRIVTKSDLDTTERLSKEITDTITPKRKSTARDLSELQHSIEQQMKALSELTTPITEAVGRIAEQYSVNTSPLIQTASATQKSLLGAANLNSSVFSSAAASQDIMRQFIENSGINSLVKAQQSAFSSIANIPNPILSDSTITAITQMQKSITHLNLQAQFWSDDRPSPETNSRSGKDNSNNEPSKSSSDDGEKEDSEPLSTKDDDRDKND